MISPNHVPRPESLDGVLQSLSFPLLDELRHLDLEAKIATYHLSTPLPDKDDTIPPTKAETEQPNRQEDPFSDEGISKAPKKFISTFYKPPKPPSDDSSSESDSKPIKLPIPPRSDKQPATVTTTTDLKPKHYHFDLKLKPESVPQWDRNPDNLARWMSKINHLANNSPEIKEKLGKLVPRRFTQFAETWYHSSQTQSAKGLKQTGPLLNRLFRNIG